MTFHPDDPDGLHYRKEIQRMTGGYIPTTNGISPLVWLERQSKFERRFLSDTLRAIYRTDIGKQFCAGCLAIGTTTWSNTDWAEYKKYLQTCDRKHLHFAEIGGNDIDLLFFAEWQHILFNPESAATLIHKNLRDAGLNAEKRKTRVYQKSRVAIRNPKGEIEAFNTPHRIPEPNIIVHRQDARPIHICFDHADTYGQQKIDFERTSDLPHSVLFRNNFYWEVTEQIRAMEYDRRLGKPLQDLTEPSAYDWSCLDDIAAETSALGFTDDTKKLPRNLIF